MDTPQGMRYASLALLCALLAHCHNFNNFWEDKESGNSTNGSIGAPDTAAPTIPSAPAAASGGSNQINLTWTASTDNATVQSGIVYEICQSTSSGVCGTFTVSFTPVAGATTYSPTGLAASTTYFYMIRAKDAAGNTSVAAAEVSATTSAPGTVNTPTFSPVAGTFNAAQLVSMSTSTGGAIICYTTNATTPACNATPTCTIGTLYSTAVNVPATATLEAIGCAVGMTASSVATGVFTIDTVPPTVTNVTASNANATYGTGAVIGVQVVFSEVVNVTGTPQITLATGAPASTAVNYVSGSGTTTLTFSYTVASANTSADLDYTAAIALILNGGAILDAAGNAAVLTLASPGAAGSLGGNKAIVIDGTLPTVTNITASTANGSYTTGQLIAIQVTFSESVNVTGTPQLTLATGTPATTAVNYVSGSGSSTLTLNYIVASGNTTADLDYASAAALTAGTAITDGAGNAAILTLPAPGAAGSLGSNKNIVIDSVAPTVVSVTSASANATYGIGAALSIQVIFSEPVNVSGTPLLTLVTGTPATTNISYVSGTGTTTLNFNYTVAAGNNSADLDYSNTVALSAGASISDIAGNSAVLTLPAPGGAGSLGGNMNLLIDGVAPVISGIGPSTGLTVTTTAVSYTFSKACATGTVTWTRTAGNADGTSPHVQNLTGGELATGAHTGITLSNDPVLTGGTVYSIQFACTDLAGNVATPVTSTGVTYAPPGASWSPSSLPASSVWSSVAFGNGVFLAIDTNTSNKAATSPDGLSWTLRTLPAAIDWSTVTFGNGVFVAVAFNSTTTAVSADGISWSTGTMPSAASWISVVFGGGQFVAVAMNGTAAATSSDGITWTARTLPTTAVWFSVAYGAGTFVAVSSSASNIAATSPDGITWTQRTLPAAADWKTVGFGGTKFVALGQNSTIAATSADGITWSSQTLPLVGGWQAITYGNGVFVAPNNGAANALTSPDGITWTQRAMPAVAYWTSVAFGNGVFVTVASSGSNAAVSP